MMKIKQPKKLIIPRTDYKPEELLRLMKRKPSEFDTQDGCLICGDEHSRFDCPCLYEIPPDVVIDCAYDEVCVGCGRIGEKCCSKGAYAVLKSCDSCGDNGHWYWENKCPDNAVKRIRVPSIQELEEEVLKKKNKVNNESYDDDDDFITYFDSDESDGDEFGEKLKIIDGYFYEFDDGRKKLNIPTTDLKHAEELLRLMQRKPSVHDTQDGCLICGQGHSRFDCPCLDKIPPDVVIDCAYDEVCVGCGRIGVKCCSKGAYAVLKSCYSCGHNGHWYWENKCPDNAVKRIKVPSIQDLEEKVLEKKNKVKDERHDEDDDMDFMSTEQSLDNSLQNKEEDQVTVDLEKDNKKKDDNGKEIESKLSEFVFHPGAFDIPHL